MAAALAALASKRFFFDSLIAIGIGTEGGRSLPEVSNVDETNEARQTDDR